MEQRIILLLVIVLVMIDVDHRDFYGWRLRFRPPNISHEKKPPPPPVGDLILPKSSPGDLCCCATLPVSIEKAVWFN
jgi:hypothetical protein